MREAANRPTNSRALLGTIFVQHAHTVCVDPETHLVYFPLENVNGHPILRIMEADAPAGPWAEVLIAKPKSK